MITLSHDHISIELTARELAVALGLPVRDIRNRMERGRGVPVPISRIGPRHTRFVGRQGMAVILGKLAPEVLKRVERRLLEEVDRLCDEEKHAKLQAERAKWPPDIERCIDELRGEIGRLTASLKERQAALKAARSALAKRQDAGHRLRAAQLLIYLIFDLKDTHATRNASRRVRRVGLD